MQKNNTSRLVMTALFTALFCLATLVIRIPSPLGGYLNAGDALILPAAFFLGPLFGALAAGIGSGLADVLSGYALFAPATLILKFLMCLSAAMIVKAFSGKKFLPAGLLGGIAAECIMVFGYYAYSALVLGFGIAAAVEIPSNCMQGVIGVIAGLMLTLALRKAFDRRKKE